MYDADMNEEIFDLILTKALIKDSEREIAEIEAIIKHQELQEFSKKFKNSIKKISKIAKQNERTTKIMIHKAGAVAAAVIVMVSVTTNPTVSALVKEIFAKIFDTHNQYEFHDEEITIENFNTEIKPNYMPDGYILRNARYGFTFVELTYENDENSLKVDYGIANTGEYFIDNENSKTCNVLVNGKEAIFHKSVKDDKPSYLIWVSNGYRFVISAQIAEEEFVKIAESINIF